MALDLGALAPAPTKVVANLPYGIAAGAILRTIEELDGVTRWVAMVQREVGERLAASPGTSAYGVPSVLAQLACDVRVHRAVSRTGLPPGAQRRLGARRACSAPARPRRPRCARSCGPASRTGARRSPARSRCRPRYGAGVRERARAELVDLGHPADVRAERLSPEDFRALAEALA